MKQSYLNLKINDNVTLNEGGHLAYVNSIIGNVGCRYFDAGTNLIVKDFIKLNDGARYYKNGVYHKYSVRCISNDGLLVELPIFLLDKNKLGWKITDPDCNQWGRMVSPKRKRTAPQIFEFSELRWNGTENELYESTIDLSKYTQAEMESDINSFGYTLYKTKVNLKNIHDEYGKDANWIIAECIFEMES